MWAANDHLGTVGQLLDVPYGIVEHREYDAFGAIDEVFTSAGNSVPPPFRQSDVAHAGQLWDDDAELYQNRARWYDPNTGRFLGEDPAQDGNNWYAYAGNDPINFRDPTGLTLEANPLNNLFNTTPIFSAPSVSNFNNPLSVARSFDTLFNSLAPSPASNFATSPLLTPNFSPTRRPIVPREIDVIRTQELFGGNAGLSPTSAPAPSLFQRAGAFLSDFGRNYVSFLGTEARTAGQTIVNTGSSAGDFLGDHVSLAYFDRQAEASRIGRSVVDAGVGITNAASFAYNNPGAVLSGAASGAINYLNRLTNDPTVSGNLLGNFGTAFATGGATAAGKQAVQKSLTRLLGPTPRAPIQVELELATGLEKRAQGFAAQQLGETVIQSQVKQGAVNRGFDFLSFTGTGKNARLLINEVKNVTGKVSSTSFSTFGLGRSGARSFNQALGFARTAINAAGVDRATRNALLNQIAPGGNAAVRLIGSLSKGTVFDPFVNDLIGQATKFITGEGFLIK